MVSAKVFKESGVGVETDGFKGGGEGEQIYKESHII
jgi:hypothetical protein